MTLLPDESAILSTLAGRHLSSREIALYLGYKDRRSGTQIVYQSMLILERRGLVARLDDRKPIIWTVIAKGKVAA